MLVYTFIAFAVAISAFAEENQVCFNLKEIYEKVKATHDTCKEKSMARPHKDKDSCYLSYRICHLKELKALGEDGHSVDHDKMSEFFVKNAEKDKQKTVADDIKPCGKLNTTHVDKIEPYFSCIEEKLSTDCPEIIEHRKEFREEFEGKANDICKT